LSKMAREEEICKACELIAKDVCRSVKEIKWDEKSKGILREHGIDPEKDSRKACEILIGEKMRKKEIEPEKAKYVLKQAGLYEDFRKRVVGVLKATGHWEGKK